jgi:hypothetical protein
MLSVVMFNVVVLSVVAPMEGANLSQLKRMDGTTRQGTLTEREWSVQLTSSLRQLVL